MHMCMRQSCDTHTHTSVHGSACPHQQSADCVCVRASSSQVAVNVQSVDELHDPAVLAINAASAAVCTSPLEWRGPVGAVRVVVSALTAHPGARVLPCCQMFMHSSRKEESSRGAEMLVCHPACGCKCCQVNCAGDWTCCTSLVEGAAVCSCTLTTMNDTKGGVHCLGAGAAVPS